MTPDVAAPYRTPRRGRSDRPDTPVRAGLVWMGTILMVLLGSGEIRAQTPWETPMLLAPGAPAGWGFHLVDPDYGGIGGLVSWRAEPAPVGLGFRGGLYEGAFDDLALVAGVDVSGVIQRGRGDVPLDVIWFSGAGFGLDDDLVVSVPAGISAGWSFASDNVQFRPYVAPRIVLDARIDDDERRDGPGRDDDDLDLSAAVEIGLDLGFDPGWALRTAASFGDRDAVSIGIVLTPGARR